MRLLSIVTLCLFWLAVMGTSLHTVAQAAGLHGCCTTVSKVRAVNSIVKRGGTVRCQQQGIKESCNVNIVVLTWKRSKVCVDPTPRKMRNLLAILCNRKTRKGVRKPGRRHAHRKTKIWTSPKV